MNVADMKNVFLNFVWKIMCFWILSGRRNFSTCLKNWKAGIFAILIIQIMLDNFLVMANDEINYCEKVNLLNIENNKFHLSMNLLTNSEKIFECGNFENWFWTTELCIKQQGMKTGYYVIQLGEKRGERYVRRVRCATNNFAKHTLFLQADT